MTNLLSPVHEVGHWITAAHNGNDATITGWASAEVTPTLTQAVAGYWFEVLVFSIVGQILLLAKRVRWLAGFFFGYVALRLVFAFGSYDFNEYVMRVAEINGAPYDVLKTAVLKRWALLCTAVTLVNGFLIRAHYRKLNVGT
jgi:hypothetical protein